MSRKRESEPRIRFFLACEGESEHSYVRFLNGLVDKHSSKHVHLASFIINGGGNPMTILERSAKKCASEERKGGVFAGKLILMDSDVYQRTRADNQNKLLHRLNSEKFKIIWQKPDHEGFLIRHLSRSVIPTLGETLPQLQQLWPSYRKNMPLSDIEGKLDINCVKLASKSIPEFKQFLKIVGFNV